MGVCGEGRREGNGYCDYMYIVLGKHPWALTAQATKIEGRRSHGGLQKTAKLSKLECGCLPKTSTVYGDETCFDLCPSCGPQGNITVEFLDYGGRELVSLVSVKALLGNFLELPFQGIHCSLKGETPLHLSHSDLWELSGNETISISSENSPRMQL